MITKLAGGRVYDPLNGIDGEVRDLWIEDGRIVRTAGGRPGRRGDRPCRPGRHARRHRPAQPHRRRQGQHRADDAARGAPRPSSSTATAPAAAAAATTARRPSPPATPMPAWATPWRSSRRCCRSMPARRIRRWPTCRSWTKAPTSCSATTICSCGWSRTAPARTRSATMSPGRCTRRRRWRSRSSIPAASAPSSSTAAGSTSTRRARTTASRPRTILTTLADALTALGVPHPIHVHGCNLGVPGGDATTLATIAGMEGRPIHLTHLQFHSYGNEGKAQLLQRGRGHRRAGQQQPQRLGRCRPGDVRPDRDGVRRHDEPGAQFALRLAQEVGGDGHRVRGRLRRAAVPVPRPEPGQRAAMVHRARAVPADRGPVAHLPHHRPPQRRPLHHLPAPHPPADGQELSAGHAGHHPSRCAQALQPRRHRPRIHACRRSRSSPAPVPPGSSAFTTGTAISARVRWPTSPSTRTIPTASACSRTRSSS